ncbi:DUF3326 domain-containing protein [Synechococcus lacustris]|uniref:DUF3326 domain-containing protein n=1 Tax=Synechococcus lacustris TaxID=2116544 RepID=UPI0033405B2E
MAAAGGGVAGLMNPLPTLLIIPTGIACEQGGFAGDALPVARLLAAASGCLISHPNVLNGASLYWSDQRIHYVEGWALDGFARGDWRLSPCRQQRIGVLFDAAIEANLLLRHQQVLDAARATLGLDIGPVLISDGPLGVSLSQGSSGSSWGSLKHPDRLLQAGEKLKAAGATAIAVVARFPDEPDSSELQAYRCGAGVDALAGAEAIISHLLVRQLGIPCAHAPALAALPLLNELDPRAAAEELGHTFLPCVLVGLSRAPNLQPAINPWQSGELSIDQVGAVVVPAAAMGGEALLEATKRCIPVIAVQSNSSLMNVSAAALGFEALEAPILQVETYCEAAGLVVALREGLNPGSLYRPLPIASKP